MITSETVSINPALANEWLVKNSNNRHLSEDLVVNYATEMEAGRWALNGESIKFDTSGRLIDGQHRLRAIVLYGKAVKSLVLRGVDPSAFDTLDTGKRRSAGDVLSIRGVKNANRIAGVLGWIWRFHSDNMERRVRQPATRVVESVLDKFPEVKLAVEQIGNSTSHLLSAPLAIALYVLFKRHNATVADEWYIALKDGATLESNRTMFLLRERLIRNRSDNAKLPAHEVAALCIKAFNALLAQEEIKHLRHSHGEEFPRIGEKYSKLKKKRVKIPNSKPDAA